MRLQWNLDVTNGYKYPVSRGNIFAVWAGVRKVASAVNCSNPSRNLDELIKKRVFSCSRPV